MRSTVYEDSNAFARWGSLGPPVVTPTNADISTTLVAPSQAPPRSSNSPVSLEVPPHARAPPAADHLQTPRAAAGVPAGTAPGAGAGPAASSKSTPQSSKKNDATSRSDWLSYGERAPWSGGPKTFPLGTNADAKSRAKNKGGTADNAFIASGLSSPPPPLPCLVPTEKAQALSYHAGGAGGTGGIGAVDNADSLLARLAGKAKQAAAAALSASAAGAAGAAGAGTEIPPPVSLDDTFTTQSKSGPAAVRRSTPRVGSFGESGGPVYCGVGGVTAVRCSTGRGGGGRDESTAAAGGSAIGGAGTGAGAGAGDGGGARLAELCKEDKAKVARLMQDLVKLRAEKDGQKARFERLRAQNESIVREMAGLKEKFGQSMQLLRKYQNIVQEGEAAGGGAGMGTGWGSGGGDGGGSSGDISSQKATREAGAVEIRSLSEALRAAEESCQKAKHDAAVECTRREAMGGELCKVKGEAEDLRRQLDNQRNVGETSATLAAEATNPCRPRSAVPHKPLDAAVICEKMSASVGGRTTPSVRPSTAIATGGGDFAEHAGAVSDVSGANFVRRSISSSRPKRLDGDDSVTCIGGATSAENNVGAKGDFSSGRIDERVSARPSEASEDEREGLISTTALTALQEQVEELKQEVAMVGVRQLAITGLPPVGTGFFDERGHAFPFDDAPLAPHAASVVNDNDQDTGDDGVSEAPALAARGGGGGVKAASGEPGTKHRVNTAPPSGHAASFTTTTVPAGFVTSSRYGGDVGTRVAQLSVVGSTARRHNGERREPARQRVAHVVREGRAGAGGRRGEVAGRTKEGQRTVKTGHGSARLDDARAVEGGRRGGVEEEEEGEEEEEAEEEEYVEGVSSDGKGVGWWARSADKLLLVPGEAPESGCETDEDDARMNSGGGTSFQRDLEKAVASERGRDTHPAGGDGERDNDTRDRSVPETGVRRGVDRLAARRPQTWFESLTTRDHPSNGNSKRRVLASEDGGQGSRRSQSPRDESQHGRSNTGKKSLLRAAATTTNTTTVPRNTKLRVSWSSISARSTEDSDDTANDFPVASVRSVSRTGQAHRWPPPQPPPPPPPPPPRRNAWGVSPPLRSSAASYTVQGDQRRGRGVVETLPVNDASGTRRRRLGSGGGTPPLATPPAVPGPSGRRATQARGRDAAAGRRLGQDRRPVPAAAPVLAAREDDMSRAGDSDASLAGGRHHRRRVNAEEAEIPEHPSRTSSVAARGGNRDGSRATRNGSDDGFGGWLEGSTSGVVVRQASGSWEAAGGGRSSPGDGGAYKAVGKGVNRGEGGRVGRARGALPKGNEPVLPSESAEEVVSTLEGGSGFFDGSLLDLIDDLEERQGSADELHSAAKSWRDPTNHEHQRTSAGRESTNHDRRSGMYSGGGRGWERRDDREGSRDEEREAAVIFYDVGDY